MKVTEFSESTKQDHVSPPWEKYLGADDFISYLPSYQGGTMRELFDEKKLPTDDVGDITYYLFDPIKSGKAASDGKYPLVIFIHGATNSFDGRICVSHSGGEMFATEKYQEEMGGGAFILVPLANEKKDENGELCDSWNPAYFPHLKKLIEQIREQYKDNISKVIIGGGSSGGYVTWEMCVRYTGLFDGCFPVSSSVMPDVTQLEAMENRGMKVFYACGRHDEFGCYKEEFADSYDYISKMKNGILYCPEWVRNGDHGVASLYFGIEMGQHCMITQLQANLMFDDGTPYCAELPHGITGWIKNV